MKVGLRNRSTCLDAGIQPLLIDHPLDTCAADELLDDKEKKRVLTKCADIAYMNL